MLCIWFVSHCFSCLVCTNLLIFFWNICPLIKNLLTIFDLFSLNQDWQGAHGREEEELLGHTTVLCLWSSSWGVLDRGWIHPVDYLTFHLFTPTWNNWKKKLLTRIFSLNEDITEEIKKWDHIIQKLSKEYTNIKKERHSLVASVLSGFQH